LVYFYLGSKQFNIEDRSPIILALVLMILGDLAFLHSDNFFSFTTGLLLYLAANIMYLIAFYSKVSYNARNGLIYWSIVLGFSTCLLLLIYDGIGIFLLPVILFMIAAFGMMQTTLLRFSTTNKESFFLVFIGAVLFVTAECIIAIEKFYEPIPFNKVLVTVTYGLGNFLIIKGILKEKNRDLFSKMTSKL
jgi:uncharacterized membrane protein YhhN